MSLQYFFKPAAVAVIGASGDPTKIGRQILDNVIASGFSGGIYPINLKETSVAGRSAYASLNKLPLVVWESLLVVIAIPASLVVAEVQKCATLGVKNIIIISAGFKEDGPAGKKLEEAVQALAAEHSLNILGPNCLGFINTVNSLNATFGVAKKEPGRIAIVSQSGAIGSAALDWLRRQDFNLGYFISLGNKAVLNENDFLEYLAADPNIDLIVFYLEDIRAGQKFMALASRLVKNKPIAVLHAGESQAGTKMALSHSGAMAGSSATFAAGMERAGVIRLQSLRELFNILLFAEKDWRPRSNEDLYVITNAGGPLILTVDEISRQGLSLGRGQDLLGDAPAARYEQAINATLAAERVNNLLILLTPQTSTQCEETAQAIIAAAQKYPKKLLMASFMGGEAVAPARKLLASNNIPSFEYPEEAVSGFRRLVDYRAALVNLKDYKNSVKAAKIPQIKTDYASSFALLRRYKIPTVAIKRYDRSRLAGYQYPAVLKLVGQDFLHKSDQGGVVINLKRATELKQAAALLRKQHAAALRNPLNYLIVQKQAFKFQEIILGFKRDASFGPMLMVGQGGIYTEVFKDIKLAVSDLDLKRAREMIGALKIYPILNGARGQKKYDIKALAQALVNLARLANEHPEISELDINPLFVEENGVLAGDVRIIV